MSSGADVRERPAADVRGGGSIAVAMGVMNVCTYGFTMVAARFLGPHTYGGFAALMGLLLVVGVLQLGLQATGARRIATSPGDVHVIERSILRVSYRSALALGVLCLVATPLINSALHLDSYASAVLVAVTAVPMTVMGGQAGVLQGERRWQELALVYLANGVPRVVLGTAMLWWRPTELAAMVAVAVTQVAPVVVGAWALRRPVTRPQESAPPDDDGHDEGHGHRSVLVETLHNSHALLAFFALSNIDVLVARSVLGGREAGLYAAGVIVVKAVLFLPQFVVVVAFPSMSSEDERERVLVRSLLVVAVTGAVCALGAKLLSSVALVFVGGHEYAAVQGSLWLFAILGTLLSMLQLLVYSVVARQARRSVYAIWAGLVLLAVLGRMANTYSGLLFRVVAVDAGLFLVLLAVSLVRVRSRPVAA
ncbi:MAG: lipopolysaccharide biosynthesis protein [Marmoricola sp.]